MEKYSPHTITDPSKMLQELSRIRALGYATSIEEYDPGAAAVSAPILNNKRDIIAEISVIGTRFSYEQEHRFWLRELVEAISTIPTRRTQDSEDTIAPDA